MELSKYQKDILKYFQENKGKNIGVSAFAGTGKTFIIERMTELSNTSDIYLAFNSTIADEFKTKIKNPKTKVMTIHALAYNIMNQNCSEENAKETNKPRGPVGKVPSNSITSKSGTKLDNLKMYKVLDMFFQNTSIGYKAKSFLVENLIQLYNLCRVTLTDFEDEKGVEALISNYYLFNDGDDVLGGEVPTVQGICNWLKKMNEADLLMFNQNKTIDFTDMLYITFLKLKSGEWFVPGWNLYTNIYLDEAQDNNKLQINFLKFIKRNGGRFIFVYDENQSCYLFNGADAHALKEIKNLYFPIKNFNLPVNYRCPTSHLDLVNREFSIPIKARPDAPEGSIITIEKDKIYQHVKPGDMIIARKNKWLSDVVISLTKHEIPIYIHDKESVAQMKKMVNDKNPKDLKMLKSQFEKDVDKYNSYIRQQMAKASNGGSYANASVEIENTSSKIDNTLFLLNVINTFIDDFKNLSVRDFNSYLNRVLSVTPNKDSVMLSSIHKAKGLEAENVFILNEGKVCNDFRNSEEQNQQEINLRYIAVTRAKNNLYFVKEESEEKKKKNKKK